VPVVSSPPVIDPCLDKSGTRNSSLRSVSKVRQGTPRRVVSSCTPPESVTTATRASSGRRSPGKEVRPVARRRNGQGGHEIAKGLGGRPRSTDAASRGRIAPGRERAACERAVLCERQEPVQRVDHDVAGEGNPCRVGAFVPQVDVGVARRSGEERREPCRSRS
jgi:hypothetical protein